MSFRGLHLYGRKSTRLGKRLLSRISGLLGNLRRLAGVSETNRASEREPCCRNPERQRRIWVGFVLCQPTPSGVGKEARMIYGFSRCVGARFSSSHSRIRTIAAPAKKPPAPPIRETSRVRSSDISTWSKKVLRSTSSKTKVQTRITLPHATAPKNATNIFSGVLNLGTYCEMNLQAKRRAFNHQSLIN
jgi:hypothetical protein